MVILLIIKEMAGPVPLKITPKNYHCLALSGWSFEISSPLS